MSPDILTGIGNVLGNPTALLFIVIGTVVGIIFGAIPGLTATMAIVMFLPLTYAMTATEGISTLVALYIGGISGGLVSAILLNIPGTPSSVATCFDGHPLVAKGGPSPTKARLQKRWAWESSSASWAPSSAS